MDVFAVVQPIYCNMIYKCITIRAILKQYVIALTHHWSNKSFILWWLSCETFPDIAHLCYHPLPGFSCIAMNKQQHEIIPRSIWVYILYNKCVHCVS